MNRLKEIKRVVLALSEDDFRKFYNWITELDHERWDRQIERDSSDGLLDDLANKAVADYKKGLSKQL